MRHRYPLILFLVALFFLFHPHLPSEALAELLTATPYRTALTISGAHEEIRRRPSENEVERIPTISIKGRVRGIGFIDARFSTRRNVTWSARVHKDGLERPDSLKPILLQGSLAVGGAWRVSGTRILPSAASIIRNTVKLIFPSRAKGSRNTRQRIYTITMRLDGSLTVRASVASVPRSAGKRGACGAAVGDGSLTTKSYAHEAEDTIAPLSTTTTYQDGESELSRVVTISTDADQEWYGRYGDQSNAVIASILNTAEAIFNRQLQIRFRLVQQHVYADDSPYTSSNPSMLLTSFASNPQNRTNLGNDAVTFHKDVDVKHLFTGKDLDGQTIGIAYIGTVCAIPSMAFGVTQAYTDSANASIFAHELGHNFGANHDLSSPEGLMYPSISLPPSQSFSEASIDEMNAHLNRYGTCVSLEPLAPLPNPELTPAPEYTPDPSLTPATLTLKHTQVLYPDGPVVRLSGSLLSEVLLPMSGTGVQLIVGGREVGRSVTDSRGQYVFLARLKLPKRRKVSVYVKTEGLVVESKKLTLGGT